MTIRRVPAGSPIRWSTIWLALEAWTFTPDRSSTVPSFFSLVTAHDRGVPQRAKSRRR